MGCYSNKRVGSHRLGGCPQEGAEGTGHGHHFVLGQRRWCFHLHPGQASTVAPPLG